MKINEVTLRLPLDDARREKIVEALADAAMDTVADCGGIRDIVVNGWKGLAEYTDVELVEEAREVWGDDSPYAGEFYHELDGETNLWCVFHTETTKAYASFADESEAKADAERRNQEADQDLVRG